MVYQGRIYESEVCLWNEQGCHWLEIILRCTTHVLPLTPNELLIIQLIRTHICKDTAHTTRLYWRTFKGRPPTIILAETNQAWASISVSKHCQRTATETHFGLRYLAIWDMKTAPADPWVWSDLSLLVVTGRQAFHMRLLRIGWAMMRSTWYGLYDTSYSFCILKIFFRHVGDVGYADDACWHTLMTGWYHILNLDRKMIFANISLATSFVFEDAYNGYMNWIEPLTTSLPYHVVVGNHEAECHDPLCVLKYSNRIFLFIA